MSLIYLNRDIVDQLSPLCVIMETTGVNTLQSIPAPSSSRSSTAVILFGI